jgi:hypothetical protein
MDLTQLFESISHECEALQDRVRHLIDDQHWLTDGEFKETILRTIIRRTAPETVKVGRGFVLTLGAQSTQVDILIYDSSYPVLYRDGDLVFISPIACRGIVEVKTTLKLSTLREAALKLADMADSIRSHSRKPLFVGLFSYGFTAAHRERVLDTLQGASGGSPLRVINHAALGPNTFVKYWEANPNTRHKGYETWHQYEMERLGPGYFIHNLVTSMAPKLSVEDGNVFFPWEGKEFRCTNQLALRAPAG